MIDLLPQLRVYQKESLVMTKIPKQKKVKKEDEFLPEFYRLMRYLREEIKGIELLVEKLRTTVMSLDNRESLSAMFDDVGGLIMRIRTELDEVGKRIDRESGKTLDRIQSNLFDGVMLGYFVKVVDQYHAIESEHREKSQQLLQIHLRLKNPNMSMEELTLKQSDVTESYKYILTRHQEILQLEQNLRSVYQLFQDMSSLVDEQSEVTQRIAYRISETRAEMNYAKVELMKGGKIRRGLCSIQ